MEARGISFLKLELPAVVSHPIWVLGIKLWSSTIAVVLLMAEASLLSQVKSSFNIPKSKTFVENKNTETLRNDETMETVK